MESLEETHPELTKIYSAQTLNKEESFSQEILQPLILDLQFSHLEVMKSGSLLFPTNLIGPLVLGDQDICHLCNLSNITNSIHSQCQVPVYSPPDSLYLRLRSNNLCNHRGNSSKPKNFRLPKFGY